MTAATRLMLALALTAGSTSARTASSPPPPGAAACSSCHPARGGELPRIGGRKANDIIAAMQAFRSGARPATVMDRIAKGFSDDEVAAIATWYAAQK
jgi:cytochrome subunit of sulfide dehydrogenase